MSDHTDNLIRALGLYEAKAPGSKELLAEAIRLLAQEQAIQVAERLIKGPRRVAIDVCPTCLTRLVDGICSRCNG